MGLLSNWQQKRRGKKLRNEGMDALFVRDTDRAETCLREAADLLPTDETTLLHFGYALAGQHRWTEAEDVLTRAVKHASPMNPAPLIALATALFEMNRLADAKARLQEALQIDIKHPGAHYYLGLILLREGRIDEATEEFEEVISEKPSYVQARLLALAERQLLAERTMPVIEDSGKDSDHGNSTR